MTDLNDQEDDMKSGQLRSIIDLGSDSYQLVIELPDGTLIDTVCRVRLRKISDESSVHLYDFDSAEFHSRVFAGEIDSRAICRSVKAFRHSGAFDDAGHEAEPPRVVCPGCGLEYRGDATRCTACHIDLGSPSPVPVRERVRLVKVYETGNAAVIPLVKSMFDDAGIEFMSKGDGLQDLFGWGRVGTKFSNVVGAVEFYVRSEDEPEARAIVKSLLE